MFQTFISRHNSNFFSDKLVLTSVTPASSAPVLQTPKATSSTLYFDSLPVRAGNGGFLHCIQIEKKVNAANQVVSVGADIAFDADPKFFACLVRFESSSVPTTLPTAYDVYPLDGRHDGGYYTVKDCVTIDVVPRTPGNNVYVGFIFFFSSRRRNTRSLCDWSSDVCSSDLGHRRGDQAREGLSGAEVGRERRGRGDVRGYVATAGIVAPANGGLNDAAARAVGKLLRHHGRSEERRVGKECRSRWSPNH